MNSRLSCVLVSLCLSLGLSLVACSGGDTSDGTDPVSAGQKDVIARKCKQCHQDDLAGTTSPLPDTQTNLKDTVAYSSNLTPDKATGLGDWTDDEIQKAMREGYQKDGHPMCEPMPTFTTMGDKEVSDIIAYLRSLPAVSKQIPESTCPSMPK